MVTQSFQSIVKPSYTNNLQNLTTAKVATLHSPFERMMGVGITQPLFPKSLEAAVPIHQYRGGYRETFMVEGSPYGCHWLSETTASVETEAVKVLNFIKALNPTSMLCLFFSLLPLLCLWFAV